MLLLAHGPTAASTYQQQFDLAVDDQEFIFSCVWHLLTFSAASSAVA
jgi:hypothetical protein